MSNLKESELILFLNEMIEELSLAIEECEKNEAYDLARDNRNKRIAYKTVLKFTERRSEEGDKRVIKNIKNKQIPVSMLIDTALGPKVVPGAAIITNDEKGKTLSLCYGTRMMTITFEQVEKYLR